MRLDFECWAGLVCPGHTLPGSGPKTSATTSVWAAHLIRHSPAAGLKRCRDDLGDLPMNPGIHMNSPSQDCPKGSWQTHTHTHSLCHTQWDSRLPVSEKALPDLLLPYGWRFKCWNTLAHSTWIICSQSQLLADVPPWQRSQALRIPANTSAHLQKRNGKEMDSTWQYSYIYILL